MSETSDNAANATFSRERLLKIMFAVSLAALAASLWFGDWRITSGLFLGCLLSFAYYIWAQNSLAALFAKNTLDSKAKFSVARYYLRYLIFAFVVGAAYFLDLINVAAALCGLLTFITAVFISALIDFFTVLLRREET